VNAALATLKLAWRSLFRQRLRTALLIAVVAYATLSILFFWGFTDGFLNAIFQGQARLVAAPVAVTTEAYHADPDPVHALAGLDDVRRAVTAVPGVRAATPRLDVPALLRSPYAQRGATLRGVDPAGESAVSDLPDAIQDGRMLEAPGELVLGADLAETLDVRLGERVAVDVAAVGGPAATGLRLVGLIDTGIEAVDAGTVLAHLADARALAGVDGATELALDVPRGREAAVAAAASDRLPEGVRAYGILDQMGELARGLAAERVSMIPIGLLFSLFGAIAVTSSLVVSVMERTREFGVILALGLGHVRLAWMVVLEAILGTLLGYGVGAVLGYALLFVLHEVNVLGPLFTGVYGDFLSGLALGDEIRADVRLEYLAYAGVTVALAALFAALTPARRVARLVPAEAMRAAE